MQRFGGFVAKYMGDGVLVYFGYPQAHEDDAERAVRAGLELIQRSAVEVERFPANPRRHCYWVGRSRRSDRVGCGSGADGCRRDAEPRRASARDCRAKHGRHRREHAKASRQSVRFARPRGTGPQGHREPCTGLGCTATSSVESRFEALHASGLTDACWSREKNSNCCCGAGRRQRLAKAR